MPDLALLGIPLAFGTFLTLLQLALIVHVYNTGRPYWWIFVILFFPGFGAIAYLVCEILPELRTGDMQKLRWRLYGPRGRIAALKERIADSDTVENQMLLAQELLVQKRAAEAVEILRGCATGPFKNDAYVQYAVAEALAANEQWQESLDILDRLQPADGIMAQNMRLVRARCLAAIGRVGEAIPLWEDLELHRFSEEAAYRLAKIDLDKGEKGKAAARLEEIKLRYRKGNVLWRRAQREWFRKAKILLAQAK